MAWTYAGFEEESTDTARLTMLRQHITEVQEAISAKVDHDGKSRDPQVLKDYLSDVLKPRRIELQAAVGDNIDATSPGVRSAFVRGNCR